MTNNNKCNKCKQEIPTTQTFKHKDINVCSNCYIQIEQTLGLRPKKKEER